MQHFHDFSALSWTFMPTAGLRSASLLGRLTWVTRFTRMEPTTPLPAASTDTAWNARQIATAE
jgi:hypothetical protein